MHRKKHNEMEMPFLMSLLIVVSIVFVIALLGFMKGFFIWGIDLLALNITMLILSLIAMLKVAGHIVFY